MFSKNRVIILICAITLIIIISSLILIFYSNLQTNNNSRVDEAFRIQVKDWLKLKKIPPSTTIDESLAIAISSKNSKKARYDALVKISETLADLYYRTNDYSIREFINGPLTLYTKTNFPDLYTQAAFNVGCVDSKCGGGLSPDVKQILQIINLSSLEDYEKTVISRNLTNAAYTPDSELADKQIMTKFVVDQLEQENNSEASRAAKLLKDYFDAKYNIKL